MSAGTTANGSLVVDPAALAPMAVAERIPRAREAMDAAGCDALLVTHLTNIRYLTGFTGSAATVLLTGDDVLFVTDGRYRDQCADQLAAAGVAATIEVPARAEDQHRIIGAAATGAKRVGLEAAHISWAQQQRVAESWFPGVELHATEDLVEGLRLVKDEGEMARIAAASAVADEAFGRVRRRLGERPTEAELALELDTAMRQLGAEDVSFDTIVASGPNGAMPHHHPGPRQIVEGDLVVLDFGALLDGYHSDMSRTVWVGEPSAAQRRMWEVVAESQAAGVASVAAGVSAGDVDEVCRKVIDQAGWGEAFLHSTGHGVGLDIHEEPRVGAGSDATLGAGWVITVEPGVYLPEHGGVRIEDTVVVTDSGCRPVTLAPKDPAV